MFLLLLNYCFVYLPLFVGVLCWSFFGMHYFVSFLVLQSSGRERESWSLWFYCLLDVFLLRMSCSSSSRCRGLVCSVIVVFLDHTHLFFYNSEHCMPDEMPLNKNTASYLGINTFFVSGDFCRLLITFQTV